MPVALAKLTWKYFLGLISNETKSKDCCEQTGSESSGFMCKKPMQGESKSEKHSPKKKPCAGQSNFSKSTGFLVDNQKKNGGKGK